MNPRIRFVSGLSLAVAVILSASLLPARASVSPARGITGRFNEPMCAVNGWERVQTQSAEYAVSDAPRVCVRAEKHHATFAVASDSITGRWRYAFIGSGYTPEGEATCADPARDSCAAYPVQADRDGNPVDSFGSWLAPGSYNEAFDIWFSPVEDRHSAGERAGDTEVMIWLADPGITSRLSGYTTIDGRRFGIMTWMAGAGSWRYVAYVWLNAPHVGRGRRLDVTGLRLNPFFANAERHGWLRPDEWLWALDLGFELRWGGAGNAIINDSLAFGALPPAPVPTPVRGCSHGNANMCG